MNVVELSGGCGRRLLLAFVLLIVETVTSFAQILLFVTSSKRICTLFCIDFSVILHSLTTVSLYFAAVSRLQSVDGPLLY